MREWGEKCRMQNAKYRIIFYITDLITIIII